MGEHYRSLSSSLCSQILEYSLCKLYYFNRKRYKFKTKKNILWKIKDYVTCLKTAVISLLPIYTYTHTYTYTYIHTHTHTHTYIYIYIYNKFLWVFSYVRLRVTLETSTPEQDSKTTAHPSANPIQLFISVWPQDGLYSDIPSQSEFGGNSLKISKTILFLFQFGPLTFPTLHEQKFCSSKFTKNYFLTTKIINNSSSKVSGL